MVLFFITGNKHKFAEAKEIIPSLEQISLDLDEIQSLDSREIIEKKLSEARKVHPDEAFVVEDVSLRVDGWNGFPGPLIKWVVKSIPLVDFARMANNASATASVSLGFFHPSLSKPVFFEGSIKGAVVAPRTSSPFGWDPVFQPEDSKKTFAEMSIEEKNSMSMRAQAFKRLASFLKDQDF